MTNPNIYYPLKPVATRGRCFRRVANSNRQMSPQEIAQMHLISTGNSWDALPARDVAFDDIDLENVKNLAALWLHLEKTFLQKNIYANWI